MHSEQAQCANLGHRKSPRYRCSTFVTPEKLVFSVRFHNSKYAALFSSASRTLQNKCIWTCWKIGSCRSWRPTVRTSSSSKMVLHPIPSRCWLIFKQTNGSIAVGMIKIMSWPPRSPDSMPSDFYMGICERFSVCASFTSRPTRTARSHHRCLSTN